MRKRRWINLFRIVLASVTLLLITAGAGKALTVGDQAPDFTLPSTTGEKISLSQFRGQKPVVLYFYLFAFGGA